MKKILFLLIAAGLYRKFQLNGFEVFFATALLYFIIKGMFAVTRPPY